MCEYSEIFVRIKMGDIGAWRL